MKALIRGTEVMVEPFSEWVKNNLAWLTGTETDLEGNPIKGDGWTLVEDYVAPDMADMVETIEDTAPDTIGETVQIGDKTYSIEDLRKLIE